MKNSKKISTVILLLLLIFNSCQRDNDADDVDKRELQSFEFSYINSITCENSMLVFPDQTTFDAVIEELTSMTNALPDSIELDSIDYDTVTFDSNIYVDPIITNPVLDDFEENFACFSSLRTAINDELRAAIDDYSFSETNDPDNYFVSDVFLRTVLNDKLEVKIGNSIFKIISPELTIEIVNGDIALLNYARASNMVPLETSEYVMFHYDESSYKRNCADFEWRIDPTDPDKICFLPRISTDGCSLEWDFGDGTKSYAKMPCHEYSSPGKYIVTLTIECIGCERITWSTVVEKGTGGGCSPPVVADFTINNLGDGIVELIDNSSGSPTKYYWEREDGLATYTDYSSFNPQFRFTKSGTYVLCLTVSRDGCVDKICKSVTVDACCDNEDGKIIQYNNYATNKKMRCKLWKQNFVFFNRIGAKTVNYEYRRGRIAGKTKWRETKTEIYVKVYGTAYKKDKYTKLLCQIPESFDEDEHKMNKDNADKSYGFDERVSHKVSGIHSEHWVKDGGITYTHNLSWLCD